MNYPNILQQNLYSSFFKDKFLLVGSCIDQMYPAILKEFEKAWENVVSICLETEHYNQLVAKLFDILGTGNVGKVGFLTVNGSPHCVQVHFASKYLKRGLNKEVDFEHYVISSKGVVYQVTMEAINKSRDFVSLGKRIRM